MVGFGTYNSMARIDKEKKHSAEEYNEDRLEQWATLVDQVDKKVIVNLRDGRNLVGILGTIDEFGNMCMTNTVERIYVGKQYGDVPRGVVMIRGDNLVTLCEIDEDDTKEEEEEEYKKESPLKYVPFTEILTEQRDLQTNLVAREQKRIEGFKNNGLHYIPHLDYEDLVALRYGDDLFSSLS